MKHAIKIAGLGLLLGTAVTLAAGSASARGPMGDAMGGPGGFGQRGGIFATEFVELDANGDGQITEDDLATRAAAHLAALDADGSGSVDATELATDMQARIEERIDAGGRAPRGGDAETMATQMATRMIDARDSDDDGVLSLAELGPDAGFGRVIDRFDTDDDNAISQAEYDEAKAEMAARHADRGGRGGPGMGGKRR